MSQYGYSGGTISTDTEKYKNNLSISSNSESSPVQNSNNTGGITAITGYTESGARTGQNVMTTYSDPESFTEAISGSNGTSYAWNNVNSNSIEGNGTKSSTTGNIYGIYDMGGCLAEFTSSYVNNLTYIGQGSVFATGTSTYLATAYPKNATTAIDFNTAYEAGAFKEVHGDAIYETSKNVGEGLAWFEQNLEKDGPGTEVFLPRGGNWIHIDKRTCADCLTMMEPGIAFQDFVAC